MAVSDNSPFFLVAQWSSENDIFGIHMTFCDSELVAVRLIDVAFHLALSLPV